VSAREGAIACLRDVREQITSIVESAPPEAWEKNVYENGWSELQLLYHIASTSGVASFVLAMSRLPQQPGGGQPL
jgi:hypothetical protein